MAFFAFMLGVIMWVAMLKSGVHATLTGVIMAMFIPMRSRRNKDFSPLKALEEDHGPLWRFSSCRFSPLPMRESGIVDLKTAQVLHPVSMGIILGLFDGKQLGIFCFCRQAVSLGLTELPRGRLWSVLHGVSVLCEVGFTKSFFLAFLALQEADVTTFDDRLAVILGSGVSGVCGIFLLRRRCRLGSK